MSQAFVDAMYTKLTASQVAGTFYEAVGGRIYNEEVPEPKPSPLFPYCVYTFLPALSTEHFGDVMSLDMLVQFDLYNLKTDSFALLGAIELKLFNLLRGVSISPSGFDRGVCTFASRNGRTVEEDACRITDEVRIRGTDF